MYLMRCHLGYQQLAMFFSKVTRAVVTYWRSKGYKVVMFLDDGLAGSANFEDAREQSDSIRNSLKDLGFLSQSQGFI